ncbi:MAG: cytidylate kinase-like family protein [Clostridia bacterium]|nr:cytidylate kinase-like family protein [Clostridia bacterium]
MNKIITIGREFGSGGRELGKRLAELLGIAYYDKEIVEEISKRTQLAEGYVQQIVEQKSGVFFPITIGRTFHSPGGDYLLKQYTSVYAEQANVLREMAERSDCVIVGRCGDYILREYQPMRLFVYADDDAKFARCRQKADEHEHLSDQELRRMIKKVDKNRAKYYNYYTGRTWGDRTNYDMCINTSSVPVKELAEALAQLFKNEKSKN